MTVYVPTRVIVLGTIGAVQILTTDPMVDPSAGGGVAAPVGSIYLGNGTAYIKTGAGATAWVALSTATSVSPLADGIYGSGIDGAATDAVDRTLTRVHAYSSLTINPGIVLTPARFPIFVNGTLTIGAGGAIRQNGGNAGPGTTAGTGGGAGAAGPLGVGSAGGAGGTGGGGGAAGTASAQQPQGIGTAGQGGTGGANVGGGGIGGGSAGGTLTAQAATSGNPYVAAHTLGFFPYAPVATAVNGGSGGAGGAAAVGGTAGGGGGGGGVIVIVAKAIVNNGSIEARGGTGAAATAGNAGGGGGGGGGKIFIITRSYTGTAADVSGGAGGAPAGTGNFGAAGNTGVLTLLSM